MARAEVIPTYPECKRKARLVIINLDEIESARSGRPLNEYIQSDIARVHQTFNNLGGYDLKIYDGENINPRRLMGILRDEAQHRRLRDCEGFICMLMTKCRGYWLSTPGGEMDIDEVFKPFKEAGPSNGKPKLFFFYTICRKRMGYVEVDDVETDAALEVPESVVSPPKVQVPTEADFLIMLSNVPGFDSYFNDRTRCSYFIEALCDTVERYSDRLELQQLLSKVTNSLAIGDHRPEGKKEFMVPQIMSTLTKRFYLSDE